MKDIWKTNQPPFSLTETGKSYDFRDHFIQNFCNHFNIEKYEYSYSLPIQFCLLLETVLITKRMTPINKHLIFVDFVTRKQQQKTYQVPKLSYVFIQMKILTIFCYCFLTYSTSAWTNFICFKNYIFSVYMQITFNMQDAIS